MYLVYVLHSERTGRRYTGSCEDLVERLRQHNAGASKATRHGRPWTLVHQETLTTRSEAIRREMYLKTGAGRDELERLLG